VGRDGSSTNWGFGRRVKPHEAARGAINEIQPLQGIVPMRALTPLQANIVDAANVDIFHGKISSQDKSQASSSSDPHRIEELADFQLKAIAFVRQRLSG
jgi:hypothetical protein